MSYMLEAQLYNEPTLSRHPILFRIVGNALRTVRGEVWAFTVGLWYGI